MEVVSLQAPFSALSWLFAIWETVISFDQYVGTIACALHHCKVGSFTTKWDLRHFPSYLGGQSTNDPKSR